MPRSAAATPASATPAHPARPQKPANLHMQDESLVTDHVKFPAWVLGVMTVEAQEQRRHRSFVIREIVTKAAKELQEQHAAKDREERAATAATNRRSGKGAR